MRFELCYSLFVDNVREEKSISEGAGGSPLSKTLATKIAWSVSILPLPPPRVISIGVKTEAIVDIR